MKTLLTLFICWPLISAGVPDPHVNNRAISRISRTQHHSPPSHEQTRTPLSEKQQMSAAQEEEILTGLRYKFEVQGMGEIFKQLRDIQQRLNQISQDFKADDKERAEWESRRADIYETIKTKQDEMRSELIRLQQNILFIQDVSNKVYIPSAIIQELEKIARLSFRDLSEEKQRDYLYLDADHYFSREVDSLTPAELSSFIKRMENSGSPYRQEERMLAIQCLGTIAESQKLSDRTVLFLTDLLFETKNEFIVGAVTTALVNIIFKQEAVPPYFTDRLLSYMKRLRETEQKRVEADLSAQALEREGKIMEMYKARQSVPAFPQKGALDYQDIYKILNVMARKTDLPQEIIQDFAKELNMWLDLSPHFDGDRKIHLKSHFLDALSSLAWRIKLPTIIHRALEQITRNGKLSLEDQDKAEWVLRINNRTTTVCHKAVKQTASP